MSNCCATLVCHLWLLTWPIVSVVLGLVCGSVFGAVITTIVFVLTLVRTPMHAYKMLYVTATTDECFKGHLGPILRLAVFLLVPIPHVLFLVAITGFCGTVGVLYYVGKTTKVFYNHEYRKTMKQVESNARLERKSHLGKYIKSCQKFMEDDTQSFPVIFFLKGCCAAVPGAILGCLPFIPFSVALVGITLARVPINAYKTMKIALFTVLLKWDLKVIALVTLPIVHTLFPVAVFVASFFGSFGYFTFQTTKSIYKGESPFHKWDKFQKGIDEYLKAHQRFTGEYCEEYDHPTGIPNGWQGDTYGIPVKKILRWQWDFVMCCLFTVLSVCFCLLGSVVLALVKIVPSFFNWWIKATKEYCQHTAIEIMGTWPFYLAVMCLIPAAVPIFYVGLAVGSVFMAFRAPWKYIKYGYLAALTEPLVILRDLDYCSQCSSGEWQVFGCLPEKNQFVPSTRTHNQPESPADAQKRANEYWDKFVNQCIKTTFGLLQVNWIKLGDVTCADPSIIQSIPAVAVLTVLADSANDKGLEDGDIKWQVDGTICKEKDRPDSDGITRHLWPMAFDIKKKLMANGSELSGTDNVKAISALLCSNGEEDSDDLGKFLKEKNVTDGTSYGKNNQIRTKINNLVICMSRMKPYQERMNLMFSHDYELQCEGGRLHGDGGNEVSTEDSSIIPNNDGVDCYHSMNEGCDDRLAQMLKDSNHHHSWRRADEFEVESSCNSAAQSEESETRGGM